MVATVSQSNRLAEIDLNELFGPTQAELSVQVNDDTFPRWGDSQSSRPEKSVRIDVKAQEQKATLSQRLESALWTTLPIASLEADSENTLEGLIQSYNASWSRLHRLHDDLRGIVRRICTANVEWKSETDTRVPSAQQSLIQSTVDEMASRVTLSFGPSSSVLTADVANWSLETVRQRFTASARKDLQQFCRCVESSLKEMAELQLIGILEWVGPNACKYHFFTEVVCHDGTQTTESGLKSRERSWEERRNNLVTRFAAYIEKKTTALISIRRARHEHHVIHAFHTTIGNSTVTTLPRHRQLLDAIPDWLRDFVRVIDGTLVRELVIERECCRKTWSEVEVIDMPQFDCEPAVVIDQYALTGWGPREIQQEKQRQAEERVTASKVASDIEWRWWLTGVFPTALAFIGTAGFRPDLWPLAILALAACLFAVIQTVSLLERAGKETVGVFQYFTSLMTTLAVCGAGVLLISCFRSPVGTTPWWFLVCSLFSVIFGIGLFSAFDSLKALRPSDSSNSPR